MTRTAFRQPPRLPFLESRYAGNSTACYEPHAHPTLSIGIVESGYSLVTTGDRRFPAQPGDLLVFDAGQVHACNPQPGAQWSYHMLHLDRQWWQSVALELTGETSMPAIPAAPIRDAVLARDFAAFNLAIIEAEADEADDFELALLALINRLISHLQENTTAPRPPSQEPAWVTDIRRHIESNYIGLTTIDDLCERAQRSKGPLIRQFKQWVGLTPYAYLQNHRINEARKRLAHGCGIADVAQELGFADQSHLNRLFKRLVATTPGIYRNAMRQRSPHQDLLSRS